ncbi:hypothetical protein ACVHYJ_19760 [Burkholderia pyrrocinia]
MLAMPRHHTQQQIRQPVQALPAFRFDFALADRVDGEHGGGCRACRVVVERERGHADEQVDRARHFREHDAIDLADSPSSSSSLALGR